MEIKKGEARIIFKYEESDREVVISNTMNSGCTWSSLLNEFNTFLMGIGYHLPEELWALGYNDI